MKTILWFAAAEIVLIFMAIVAIGVALGQIDI
jgi:hypothetical protein